MSWDQPVYSFNYGQPPTPTRTPTSATFGSNTFSTPKAESSFYDPRVTWNTADPHATSPNLLKTPKPFTFSTPIAKPPISSPSSDTPLSGEDLEAQIASHVHHLSTTPNLSLPPVEPSRQLSSSPVPKSSKRRYSDTEEESDPRTSGLALDTGSAMRSAGSMQTPPPTSTSASRRRAQQAQVAKLVQQSASAGRRMSTPLFPKNQNGPVSAGPVETSPQPFSELQFSPDVFDFSMTGPATAPILPQHKLFWDSKPDDGLSMDFSDDLTSAFDRPNQPALDPFVSAHHHPTGSNLTTSSFSLSFPKNDLMHSSMTTAASTFDQGNHFSTDGSKRQNSSYPTRRLAHGVDPSLLFSSPGRSLDSRDGPADSSVILDEESLQPYAYQMQEARRELASGTISKPKKKRKPDVDSPAVKAALKTLRDGDADQPQLQPDRIETTSIVRRASPVKRSHSSLSRRRSSRPSKHRTSIALTIDASGRARTETRTFVESKSNGSAEDQMDMNSDSESSDSDTSSDDTQTAIITSQPPSFQFPAETTTTKLPKLGRFVTKSSNHSQKSSYTSVYTSSSYAESLPLPNGNKPRTMSTLSRESKRQAQADLPALLPPALVTTFDNRLNSREDIGSEDETIMETDEGDGSAQHELRKVLRSRERTQSANRSAKARSKSRHRLHSPLGARPTSRDTGGTLYAGQWHTQNTSPSTITDPDLATPSSTRSTRDLEAIRCVCHMTSREGQTIQCESCKKYSHIKCVGLNVQRLPKIYLCVFCTGQTPVVRGGRVRDGATAGFAPPSSPLAQKSNRFR